MIIIPEIETVVILVPRTGSGSLKRAIAYAYPRSMLLYRHMEADGLPLGYDRWRKVGVVRHPLARLWSLYKFLKTFSGSQDPAYATANDPAYVEAMRRSVAIPFSDWIISNETVFTNPYDRAGRGRYWPHFTVRHSLPETRKSQFLYLRPDLGTEVWRYAMLGALAEDLGIRVDRDNATESQPMPPISIEAGEHINRFFAWDLAAMATDDQDQAIH